MTDFRAFLDRLHSTADIVEVVGQYVPLKRSGIHFKGLCPFHKEKTPSFVVSREKQLFHCYGCGVGGDVISFVQKQERLEFRDAVELLAQRFQLVVPQFKRSEAGDGATDSRKREALYELHNLALKHYCDNLNNSAAGTETRRYLKERGIEPETQRKFGLGLALAGGTEFADLAKTKGFSEAALIESGLAKKRREGTGVYDTFRNRLTFPLWNRQGQIVGFAGRALAANDQPKYLNSPETPIYKKGDLLYGYHLARQAVIDGGHAILVEGYMDAIALFQGGFQNVVATSGTALTQRQARMIKSLTPDVLFLYDGDEAGQQAMLRGCTVLLPEALKVRVVTLPPGEDPDTYLKREGTRAVEALLGSGVSAYDFFLKAARQRVNDQTAEGKTEVIDFLVPLIQAAPNEIIAEEFMRRLAEELAIEVDLVRRYVQKQRRAVRETLERQLKEGTEEAVNYPERAFLKIIVEQPSTRSMLNSFDLRCLTNDRVRGWAQRVLQPQEGEAPDTLEGLLELSGVGENEARFLREILFWDVKLENYIGILDEIVRRLRINQAKRQTALYEKLLKETYKSGDPSTYHEHTDSMHQQSVEILEQQRRLFGEAPPPSA